MKNEIINRAISKEDKVIGNLKNQFIRPSLRSQIHTKISPTEVSGNIALAYHRGLAVARQDMVKEIVYKLKEKYPKASEFIKELYKKK